MTGCVVDASSVLAWCFEDEGGPEADALIDQVAAEGADVPGSWSLEVANGLVAGERRGRIKAAESAAFIAMSRSCRSPPTRRAAPAPCTRR